MFNIRLLFSSHILTPSLFEIINKFNSLASSSYYLPLIAINCFLQLSLLALELANNRRWPRFDPCPTCLAIQAHSAVNFAWIRLAELSPNRERSESLKLESIARTCLLESTGPNRQINDRRVGSLAQGDIDVFIAQPALLTFTATRWCTDSWITMPLSSLGGRSTIWYI